MTTLKKIFAAATAVASVGVLTMATIPASAVVEIPYSGPSADALIANDDGKTARVNIINEWTQNINVQDINKNTVVNEFVEVEFEITGLGDKSSNVDDAGNPTDSYVASLQGQIGGVGNWGDAAVTTPITGDGTYTVRWDLTAASESIECLILSTNINFYQLKDEVTSIDDSGLSINVLSVTTGDDPANAGSGEESGDTTTTTTTTGEGGEGSTTTTTTTKNNSSSGSSSNKNNSSSSSSNKTSNSTTSTVTKTADAGVVAIVVGAAAAASLAVGTMTYKRKRK